MFYIVETDSNLGVLKSYNHKGGYVEFIPTDYRYHPLLTSLVAVYLHPFGFERGFIIPIDHEEGINVDKQYLLDVLGAYDNLYTLDRKTMLYYGNLQKTKDISLLYSMVEYERLEVEEEYKGFDNFYRKYSKHSNINQIIPLSKHYERCESNYNKLKPLFSMEIPSGFDYYNRVATNIFYLIEQEGIGIDENLLKDNFSIENPEYSVLNGKIYTKYNLYNVTSRPTNSFNGINFLALPKNTEHRKTFKPVNDFFVEFDFDGYHIRLIADQIGYKLTEEPAHRQLAKTILEKEEITEEEQIMIKNTNFKALYGNIPENLKKYEFFQKLDSFIQSLWKEFKSNGVIYDPITKKPFTSNLQGMNPKKLFNYFIQSLETSRNILILKEVLKCLSKNKTKMVKYVYDSIILDFSKEDSKEVLKEVEKIVTEGGKYPVSFSFSKNLSF